jgi:hypothetical protein
MAEEPVEPTIPDAITCSDAGQAHCAAELFP